MVSLYVIRKEQLVMQKQLSLGMSVHCTDGEAGRLEKIVADPETHEPAYLVVRRGLVSRHDVVVPVGLVRAVDAETLSLDATTEALRTFPEYEITVEKRQPPKQDFEPSWPPLPPQALPWEEAGVVKVRQRTVPAHTIDIRRGMTVYDPTGVRLGQVEGVIVDAERRQASHLALRRPHPLAQELRLVPVDLVDFVIRSDVYLLIPQGQVQGLATYQPDP
jgi:sporulation protein YlmC with PRC-barrel domain